MTNTLKAENVQPNGFLHNLGDDYVAVDDYGRVMARADKATIERDYPNATRFTGKDFPKSITDPTPVKAERNASAVVPDIPGVPQTPSGHPVADALADDPTPEPGTRTHPLDDGTPYEGPATVDATNAALNTIAAQSGTPIKDALEASHDASTEAENAGRHAKQDELQAEQAKALEADGVKLTAKKDPLDHDGDSRKGGSLRGKDSTASKGAAKKAEAKKS